MAAAKSETSSIEINSQPPAVRNYSTEDYAIINKRTDGIKKRSPPSVVDNKESYSGFNDKTQKNRLWIKASDDHNLC